MSCASITDLSLAIWNDLGQPTDLTPAVIQAKLVSDAYLGKLSNLTTVCYASTSGDISPAIGTTEQSIYSLMYQADYYTTKLNQTLAGYNTSFTRISEGDSTIVRSSTTEVAKTYLGMKKQLDTDLTQLVTAYRTNNMLPLSVDYLSYMNAGASSMIGPTTPYRP